MELDPLPWWITYDSVKSAGPPILIAASRSWDKYIRECKMPVEEAVSNCEALDFVSHPRFASVWIALDASKDFFRDWVAEFPRLLPYERCTPCVGPETPVEVVPRADRRLVHPLFLADGFDGVVADGDRKSTRLNSSHLGI